MQYFSLYQKFKLARSLVTKASPAYVQFYITARCNLTCEQCNIIYADADAVEMTLDEIQRVAENLAAIGVCTVLLIGGEPFVRKDLPLIVKAFTDQGIHVRLQTNGFATRQALEACVANGARDISISLDTLSPGLQDEINGGFGRSWEKAMKSISIVNEVFPDNSTAFFGTVLMPKNIDHIIPVIEFATQIGWGVSLVPVHTSDQTSPLGFRSFDPTGVLTFQPGDIDRVESVLSDVKRMRQNGYLVYDSDEYLDDILRFVANKPITWRRRNMGTCDSPNLYFAIAPNGDMKACCDYHLSRRVKVQDPDFPICFQSGEIEEAVRPIVQKCDGCMYGSYPEISISARFLNPFLRRFWYFNVKPPKLIRMKPEELENLAVDILNRHSPVPS